MPDIPLPIISMMIIANFNDRFAPFMQKVQNQEVPVRSMGVSTRAHWEAYVRGYTPTPSGVRTGELQMAYDELVLESENPDEALIIIELMEELSEDDSLPDSMAWESPDGDIIETHIKISNIGPTGFEAYGPDSEELVAELIEQEDALYAQRDEFERWMLERFSAEQISGVGMSDRLSAQILLEGRDARIAESVIEVAERLLNEGEVLHTPTLLVFSNTFESVEEIDLFGDTRVYLVPLSLFEGM